MTRSHGLCQKDFRSLGSGSGLAAEASCGSAGGGVEHSLIEGPPYWHDEQMQQVANYALTGGGGLG
jgi:hypothetical protein